MEEQSSLCSELNCFPKVFIKSKTQRLAILQTLLQSAAGYFCFCAQLGGGPGIRVI